LNTTARLAVTGLLFLLKLATGYWLSRKGRPYNVGISTLHKIISLLVIASIALTVRYLRQGVGLSGAQVSALVVSGVLFLVAIGTGGVLSMDRPAPAIVSIAHKVAPYLALVSSVASIYFAF
jgi:hypothetical protein